MKPLRAPPTSRTRTDAHRLDQAAPPPPVRRTVPRGAAAPERSPWEWRQHPTRPRLRIVVDPRAVIHLSRRTHYLHRGCSQVQMAATKSRKLAEPQARRTAGSRRSLGAGPTRGIARGPTQWPRYSYPGVGGDLLSSRAVRAAARGWTASRAVGWRRQPGCRLQHLRRDFLDRILQPALPEGAREEGQPGGEAIADR